MGDITRKRFLQGAIALAGVSMLPLENALTPAVTHDKVVGIVQDMTPQQCHAVMVHLFYLRRWRYHQEWWAHIKEIGPGAEYNIKDLPQGFDLWVNSLETAELEKLYCSIEAETDEKISQWKLE